MSKENVTEFINHLERHEGLINFSLKDLTPEKVVSQAEGLGFSFTKEDLKSVLNTRICNAESLPRPWGWDLARKFGLVRS